MTNEIEQMFSDDSVELNKDNILKKIIGVLSSVIAKNEFPDVSYKNVI